MKSFPKLNLLVSFLLLIFLFGVFPNISLAERAINSYGYTKTFGKDALEIGNSVATDSSGNVYITGFFGGTDVDFDPSPDYTDPHSSGGFRNIFLTKINADGTYGYTKTFGGDVFDEAKAVAVDSHGNVFVAGYFFSSSVDFNPGVGVDTHTNNGGTDIFLTKINADGTYGYTKTIGGAGSEIANGISVDSDDNIYITGLFSSAAVDFNPNDDGSDPQSTAGDNDIFLTKINADGTYGYTKTIGGAGAEAGNSVFLDSQDNIYITGLFSSAGVDFNPNDDGSDPQSTAGDNDIFLTKINADGTYGYTKTIGGAGDDRGNSVGVDSSGNAYVTGYFSGAGVDFNPSTALEDEALRTSAGDTDIFLLKINTDGTYGYANTIGGGGADVGSGLALDSSGNVYITGTFWDIAVDFNYGPGSDPHTSSGNEDIFLTKINADETYGYTKVIGANDYEAGRGVAVDPSDNKFVTGYYYSVSINFNSYVGADTHTSDNTGDVFLTKFAQVTYFFIKNLTAPLSTETSVGAVSVDDVGMDDGILADEEENIRLLDDGVPLADMDVTFSIDLDLSTVSGDSDPATYKSFVNNLTSVSGNVSNYTLYVPFREGDVSVTVCPGATSLSEISENCSGAVSYINGAGASLVTIGANQYWSVPSQTTGGGVSVAKQASTSGSRPSSFVSKPIIISNNINQPNQNPTESPQEKYTFLRNLRLKNTGEDVKELQKYLNAHGFIIATTGNGSLGNESTYFGLRTKTALMKFQKSKGLVPDGIMGPITRAALNAN